MFGRRTVPGAINTRLYIDEHKKKGVCNTVASGELDAGGGGEQAVAALAAAHARRLEELAREVVVERVLARGIVAVERDAFEAIDRIGCVMYTRAGPGTQESDG